MSGQRPKRSAPSTLRMGPCSWHRHAARTHPPEHHRALDEKSSKNTQESENSRASPCTPRGSLDREVRSCCLARCFTVAAESECNGSNSFRSRASKLECAISRSCYAPDGIWHGPTNRNRQMGCLQRSFNSLLDASWRARLTRRPSFRSPTCVGTGATPSSLRPGTGR